jgi:hypothetical protein
MANLAEVVASAPLVEELRENQAADSEAGGRQISQEGDTRGSCRTKCFKEDGGP